MIYDILAFFTPGPIEIIIVLIVLPVDGFQQSLREYYALRGWDVKGVPTAKKLKELGLDKYA